MEMPEQIWFLIARTLSGEASSQEQQQLQEILQKDEQLQQKYDLLSRIWAAKQENLQQENNNEAKSIVSLIIYKAETENGYEVPVLKRRLNWRKVFMAAASVLVVVSAGWLWFSNTSSASTDKKQDIIEAHRGTRTSSILPDGSTVWLNAGSKLYYENDFTGATREVRLEGEAFFDVVKQPDHPFIVHTSGIDIKVLGTAFNVKSYPEDKTVETTLYRGSVKVFRHEGSEKTAIHLKPNEKLTLLKEAATVRENLSQTTTTLSADKAIPAIPTIAHIDSTKKENERIETAWVYNRLEFRGDNFEELAKKLERWYNVKVVFTDEKIKQLTVDGSFEKETVEQAFVALKTGFPITYKINISNHEIFVGSAK
jgi:transmembrane sensor